jgi:hypothetical protein
VGTNELMCTYFKLQIVAQTSSAQIVLFLELRDGRRKQSRCSKGETGSLGQNHEWKPALAMFSKEITQDETRPERCEVFGDDLLTTMVKRNPIVIVAKLSEDLIVFTRLCINSLNREDFQTGSMGVMN